MTRFFHALVWVLILAPSLAHGAGVVKPASNNGLLGYWPLNQSTGSSALDASPNGKHATLTNSPTWTTSGKLSSALTFGASSNFASTTVRFTSSGTIAVWAYPTSVGDWRAPAGFKSGVVENYGYALLDMGNANRWRAVFRPSIGGNPESNVSSRTTFTTNQWYHLAMTWSLSGITYTVKLYVNGVYQGETTWSGTPGSVGLGNFHFGNGGDYADNYFTGRLDEPRVYNRALSAAEVATLYANPGVTIATLSAGLVAHWTFDVADTANAIYDRRGGIKGYFVGGATSTAKVPGRLGEALNFDGSATYVDMGDVHTQSGSFSLSAWFKRAGNSSGVAGSIIGKEISSNRQYFIEAMNSSASNANKIRFAINDVDTTQYSATTIVDDTWYHVVATYDDATKRKVLYVNGVYDGAVTGSGSMVANSESLKIGYGRGTSNASNYFNGAIDDVRIYNRPLTAAEAAQLYRVDAVQQNASSVLLSKGNQFTNNLVGHWTFDGADFTTSIADKSGQGAQAYLPSGISTSSAKMAGKLGQALRLNGSSCAITPTSLSGLSAFTLSGWVNAVSAGTRIGFFGQNDVIEFGFVDSDTIGGWTSGGSATASWDFTASSFPLNTWNHVALTGSASGVSLYVNGALVASATGAANFGTSAFKFNIGGCGVWDNTGNGLTGGVDDVRVYTRMLRADEIRQLYTTGGTGGPRVPAGGGGSAPPGNEAA